MEIIKKSAFLTFVLLISSVAISVNACPDGYSSKPAKIYIVNGRESVHCDMAGFTSCCLKDKPTEGLPGLHP